MIFLNLALDNNLNESKAGLLIRNRSFHFQSIPVFQRAYDIVSFVYRKLVFIQQEAN